MLRAGGMEDDMLTMVDVHMGVPSSTAKKYINMWEKIFDNPGVPDDIKEIMGGKPIGELLLLAPAIGEGSLTGKDLRGAALATSKDEIRGYIKKVRGIQTSAGSAIVICLNMRDKSSMAAGTLYAKQGDKREIIDFQAYAEGTASDLVQKAITRIINAIGVQEIF
jgi:hypothetical protein